MFIVVNVSLRLLHVIFYSAVFIYEDISKRDVNKSANRLDIYAPKVELYHLQFMSSFAGVKIKYRHYISYLHGNTNCKIKGC